MRHEPLSTSPTPPGDRARHRHARDAGPAVLAVTLASLLGFLAVAALVALGDTAALDLRVTLALQKLRTPPIYWVMFVVSWPGFIPRSLVIGAVILVALLAKRLYLEARFAAIVNLLAVLDQPIKLLFQRTRPVAGANGVVVYGHATGFSFPSGHVLSYTLILGLLAYFASSLPRRERMAPLIFLLTTIVLVGPSRVYLGQHWFSDVLASYLLGIGLLTPLLVFYRRAKTSSVDGSRPTPHGNLESTAREKAV